MKKYFSVIMLFVFVFGLLIYGQHLEERKRAEKKIIPATTELIVYSDLPQNLTAILASAYEKKYHVRITLLPLTEEQLIEKVNAPKSEKKEIKGDLIFTYQDTLALAAKNNYLVPYVSENTDLIADQFKNTEGLWVGLWYNPLVFVEHEKFIKKHGKPIVSWKNLTERGPWTISLTDFVASRSAANIFYQLVEVHGVEEALYKFIRIQPHVIQYAKFLNTPVRLVAMGSSDLAIANYSDAASFVFDKYPLKIVFPTDGVPYHLMGIGILQDSKKVSEAQLFVQWLLSEEVRWELEKEKVFFQYTNPALSPLLDSLGKEANLLNIKGNYTEEGKKELLTMWIEQVRFRKDV